MFITFKGFRWCPKCQCGGGQGNLRVRTVDNYFLREIDVPVTWQAPTCANSGFRTVAQWSDCLLRVHPLLGACNMLVPFLLCCCSPTPHFRSTACDSVPDAGLRDDEASLKNATQQTQEERDRILQWVNIFYNLVLQVTNKRSYVGKRHNREISLPATGSAMWSYSHEGMFLYFSSECIHKRYHSVNWISVNSAGNPPCKIVIQSTPS